MDGINSDILMSRAKSGLSHDMCCHLKKYCGFFYAAALGAKQARYFSQAVL
jgi:hypothetical protein